MYQCVVSSFFLSIIPWIDIAVDHQALLKQFEYLNHMNPHTFEVDDLDRLIRSVSLTAKLCHKNVKSKTQVHYSNYLNYH